MTSRSLDDRLDNPPKPWVPKQVGDRVSGRVTDVGTTGSDFSTTPVPTVTLEIARPAISDGAKVGAAGDELIVIGFASVLASEIRRKSPRPGDDFGAKYVEDREGARGPYKWFATAIERHSTPGVPGPPDEDPFANEPPTFGYDEPTLGFDDASEPF